MIYLRASSCFCALIHGIILTTRGSAVNVPQQCADAYKLQESAVTGQICLMYTCRKMI